MGRDTPLHACLETERRLRRRLQDGGRAARALRRRSRRQARASTSRAGSKGCAARTASTPPRSSSRASRSPSTCRSSASPSRARAIEDAPIVTQYEMHGVEELGLLKMDFLGLRNLDVHRDRARPHRALHGRPARHRRRPARRRRRRSSCCGAATRSACSSSKAGRCARCCARSRPRTFEDVAALVALYRPGPDGAELAQRVRRPQERPQAGHLRPPRPRGDPRAHLRADDLPGAADARRAEARRATRSRRPTTSARRRARRSATLIAQGALEVRRRLRRATATPSEFAEQILRHDRAVRRLLVQQVAHASATASSRTRPRG